jgi:hypothetical protein
VNGKRETKEKTFSWIVFLLLSRLIIYSVKATRDILQIISNLFYIYKKIFRDEKILIKNSIKSREKKERDTNLQLNK